MCKYFAFAGCILCRYLCLNDSVACKKFFYALSACVCAEIVNWGGGCFCHRLMPAKHGRYKLCTLAATLLLQYNSNTNTNSKTIQTQTQTPIQFKHKHKNNSNTNSNTLRINWKSTSPLGPDFLRLELRASFGFWGIC